MARYGELEEKVTTMATRNTTDGEEETIRKRDSDSICMLELEGQNTYIIITVIHYSATPTLI